MWGIRRFETRDLEGQRALLQDESIAGEYEALQGPQSLEAWLADPFRDPRLHFVAEERGRLIGFASPFVLAGREHGFAATYIGVIGHARRRGLGSALLAQVEAGLLAHDPAVHESCLNAWLPSPEAEGFARKHAYERVRSFWLMARDGAPPRAPEWPPGITLKYHEASERQFQDLSDVYNDSFEHHYHSTRTDAGDMRALYTRPGFRPDGYVLAYRGGRPAGFCRCDLHEGRGEITVLGTSQSARGIGLGRALLRWGVQWLERERTPRVTLLVDGENEGALRLHRSEGFEVVRTRAAWSREPGRDARA